MSKPWYEGPMRIAALQGVADPYEALQVVDLWAEMGFNVEQGSHFFRGLDERRFRPATHGPILAAYAERAHAAGVRLILYVNVHTLPTSTIEDHPDWLQHSRDGGLPKLYDTAYACCVNSPWRDDFFALLDDLAPYDIDGIFLDGPVVVGGGCYCESCKARFREWYGGDLLSAQDTWDFYRRSKDEFLMEGYQRFKASHPDGVYYMNLPATHPGASYVNLKTAVQYNDIVGTEGGFMFYSPPKDAYLWKPSVAAKMLEAVAPDKPRVIFMAADQKPWGWYMHTAVETKLCIASIAANASSLWYGPHNSMAYMDTPGGQAARDIVGLMARHETYYDQSVSAAKVAIMYSIDTDRSYRRSTEVTDLYGREQGGRAFVGNFTDAFHGLCDALSRSGVPFDIVTDLELSHRDLEPYDVIYLPTCACLSDGALAAIRRYVADGGTVVATFDTSLYTPDGQRRPDFGLSDVLGASMGAGPIDYKNWNYVSLAGQPSAEAQPLLAGLDLPLYPAPAWGLDVKPRDGAEVLAQLHGVMPGRYAALTAPERPAIILNRYGEGRCLYLAGTFAEMCLSYAPPEYVRLLVNVVDEHAGGSVRLEGGLGDVEVVARRQGQRLIVHLINYAGPTPRPFTRVPVQRDLALRFALRGQPYESARALVADCPCAWRHEGDDMVVHLPDVHEYEVIVIE